MDSNSGAFFHVQQIKDDIDDHNRPVNNTLDIIAELVETGADVLSAAELNKLQQEGKQLKVRTYQLTYLLLEKQYPVRRVGGQQIRPCEVLVVSHHVLVFVHWYPVLGLALGLSKNGSGFILVGTIIVQGFKLVGAIDTFLPVFRSALVPMRIRIV